MSARWESVPMCDACWDRERPGRSAVRVSEREDERCQVCQASTRSGIYVRMAVEEGGAREAE